MTHPTDPYRCAARGTLHDQLAGLAEEVHGADLRDRALATSRRSTRRRRVVTASSAVAVAAVLAGGIAWAGRPAPSPVLPAVSPSVSPATTAPVVPDSPPPSTPPPPPSAPPSSTPTSGSPGNTHIPSLLYYFSTGGELDRLKNGSAAPVYQPRPYSCGLTVSPDLTWIAWVDVDGGGTTGDLMVSGPNGANKRTVLQGVACTGGNSPVWWPDGEQLLVRSSNTAPREAVNVRTGQIDSTPFANVKGYLAFSPDGSYAAYADGNKIVVARSDGTVVHRVAHGDETPTGGFSVQGVSDDGTRVIVGMRNTDPDIVRTGFRLVDVTTGRNVALPGSLPSIPSSALYFSDEGRMLVRVPAGNTHRLYLIGPDGQVHNQLTEDSNLNHTDLITSF